MNKKQYPGTDSINRIEELERERDGYREATRELVAKLSRSTSEREVMLSRRIVAETAEYRCSIAELEEENKRLRQWVKDLQSGMYVNCVYCGHRYGPSDKVPTSMAEVLKEHVEQCPKHPMSELKEKNK